MITKQELRRQMRSMLSFPPDVRGEKSARICEQVRQLPAWERARNVVLFAQPGKTDDLMATLVRFGLKYVLHKSMVGDWFVVEVPKDFETQWVSAFRALPSVASAHLNHRISPA